jgi:hypothetical protein
MIAKTILEIMKIQPHQNTNIISGLLKGNKVVLGTEPRGNPRAVNSNSNTSVSSDFLRADLIDACNRPDSSGISNTANHDIDLGGGRNVREARQPRSGNTAPTSAGEFQSSPFKTWLTYVNSYWFGGGMFKPTRAQKFSNCSRSLRKRAKQVSNRGYRALGLSALQFRTNLSGWICTIQPSLVCSS